MSASSLARCSFALVPHSARSSAVALGQREEVAVVALADGFGCRRRPRSARRRTRGSSRASPAACGRRGCRRRTSRLLATRRSSVSRPAPVIASAASTVAPPAKTAKRAKHGLLVVAEQLVAPVDRRAQRLLARGRVTRAGTQRAERRRRGARAISARRQQPAAGGRELDRQRQPVDAPADLRDRGGVVRRSSSKSGSWARARSANSATASPSASASGLGAARRAARAAGPGGAPRPATRAARGWSRAR